MTPLALLAVLLLPGRALAADTFEDRAFYFGDPHVHTGASADGGSTDLGTCEGTCGAVTDLVTTAKANGLDWLAITDHVNGGSAQSAEDFATVRDLALAADDPEGGFVTVLGGEVWLWTSALGALGHRSLFFFGDNASLAAVTLVELQPNATVSTTVADCAAVDTWMTRLIAAYGDAVLLPHHPSATIPMATNWDCFNAAWEPAVEFYSAHGNGLWDGNPYDHTTRGNTATGTVHYALDPAGAARKLGFLAATDTHDTRAGSVCDLDTEMTDHAYGGGLTVVMLESDARFDRGAIRDAIVERRTYATSGPRLPALLSWQSGGASLGELGADLGLPTGQDLDVEVRVPTEWVSLVTGVALVTPDTTSLPLSGDGDGRWSMTVASDDVPAWLYAAISIDGDALRGTQLCDDGGDSSEEWVWLSPSYVSRTAGDLDGDGVAFLDGDCDDGDPSTSLGAPEIWYDGVDQDCLGGDDFDQDLDTFSSDVDCDDTDAAVFPGAVEAWYDGRDADCSGGSDYDQDGDGADRDADCDDTDPAIQEGCRDTAVDTDTGGEDTPVRRDTGGANVPGSRCGGCDTGGVGVVWVWGVAMGGLIRRRRLSVS